MRPPASIFNDVMGPVMVGPSSSHTVASVRIGRLLRDMAGGEPRKAVFCFPRGSSLAATYHGQGADMGLAAGLLGMEEDDPSLLGALRAAEESGLSVEFRTEPRPDSHPNLYMAAVTDSRQHTVTAELISVGGGMIELCSIDGIAVDADVGLFETVFLLGPVADGEERRTELERSLGGAATVRLHRATDGAALLLVLSREPLPWDRIEAFAYLRSMELSPVLPIRSPERSVSLFDTGADMLRTAARDGLSPWETALLYEQRRSGESREVLFERMRRVVRVWKNALADAQRCGTEPLPGILPRQAHLLPRTGSFASGVTEITRNVTLMMEAKSAMKVIVACPTAGSCGIVPGVILSLGALSPAGEDELVRAALAAGLAGIPIAAHATFAAEMGGCQAECGSASAMAAAAAVQLRGGSLEQALNAASMALQNTLGLICDPVADRAEVPCLGKNVMCALNAVSAAEMALAGFDAVIPFDETVEAMGRVGQLLPSSLRCTGEGGLSVTKGAKAVERRLARELLSDTGETV